MKTVYLKNFRKGWATNSSSTHSVIYRNKEELMDDLNIFELDYYGRYDQTIAASREAKIKYVTACIMYDDNLLDVMSHFYPEMKQYFPLIEEEKKNNDWEPKFGQCYRGRLSTDNLEFSIEYLRNIIDNDDILIIGGSDEEDWVYDQVENHVGYTHLADNMYKNGNYWYGYDYGSKIRVSTSVKECIPEYPELVDLKITNACNNGCSFCYANSNILGKHAELRLLRNLIGSFRNPTEFVLGGGNVLLYPDLEELLRHIIKNRHYASTTLHVNDLVLMMEDKELYALFKAYIMALGISITEASQMNVVLKYENKLKKLVSDVKIHLIPELIGVDETLEILDMIKGTSIGCLFLGYKSIGRGVSFTPQKLEGIDKIIERADSFDTQFINTFKCELRKCKYTRFCTTYLEGEYSMFIDGVSGNAYKSSYQLDKPYYVGLINDREKRLTVKEAFANIRRDNNLSVYGDI